MLVVKSKLRIPSRMIVKPNSPKSLGNNILAKITPTIKFKIVCVVMLTKFQLTLPIILLLLCSYIYLDYLTLLDDKKVLDLSLKNKQINITD